MPLMEIDKQLADFAKAFFQNYSQQSIRIGPMSESLAGLVARLTDMGLAMDRATEQAKRNAEAVSELARSLNRYSMLLVVATFALVLVGILQVGVMALHH
jgi:hypothetical protein